jgi:hypothetical protein
LRANCSLLVFVPYTGLDVRDYAKGRYFGFVILPKADLSELRIESEIVPTSKQS